MNLHAINGGSVEEPRAGKLRFAYPGGSRPLEGYTIKRGIGRGGFGEVYYATSDAGKEVALKLIRRNLDVELRGVGQCLNIKHPNLLALYDIKQDESGDSWVVMEYVAGECLEGTLQRHPQGLPAAEAMRWFCGICAGVAALHDRGIVHRDLKPGNIFFDEGLVKVGDYGLSKFISASRRSGQTESVGTVHYMAPEVGGGRYGKEIDIYALGIILYEMLTGHVPFDGESVQEVLIKHLTAQPDLSQLAEPYRTVIGRALAKDPAQRWQNVTDMLHALGIEPQAVLAGFGLPAAEPAGPGAAAGVGQGVRREALGGTPFAQPPAAANVRPFAPHGQRGTQPAGDPVTEALRRAARNISAWWHRASSAQRIGAALGIVLITAFTMPALPMTIGALAVLYAVYWVIWMAVVAPRHVPSWHLTPRSTVPYLEAERQQAEFVLAELVPERDHAPQSPRTAGRQRADHSAALPPEPQQTPRERLTEMFGSLLVSAAAVAVLSLLWIMLVVPQPAAPHYVWFALTSTIGSWCVLACGHWWRGKSGEAALRRLWMLCLGGAVGGASWLLGQWLLVDVPARWPLLALSQDLVARGTGLFDYESNQPALIAHMLFFAGAFALVRWWKQVHPRRPKHLSLLLSLFTALAAWLVGLVIPYPQPIGMLLAANISLAVQIAAPRWVPGPPEAKEPQRDA